MATYRVPLSPAPQRFAIALAKINYVLTVQWRESTEGGWFLDIADSSGVPILSGIPLVTGADLLAQFAYLNLGGQLIVRTDHATDEIPTFGNLGVDSNLYFVTEDTPPST